MNSLIFHSIAEKKGARATCPDRPGTSVSTPSPDRKLLDHPESITKLPRHLHLNSYRILGCSRGGSFPLASGKPLPKEQLLRVGVPAEMGPADFGLDGMRFGNRVLLQLTVWLPWLMRLLIEWTLVRKAQSPDSEVLRRYVESQIR